MTNGNDTRNHTYFELAKTVYPRVTVIGMALVAVCMVAAIGWGIFRSDVLTALKDPDYARGVITFIFAIGTVGIALIVTFAGLQRGRDQAERDDAKERFVRAKEVLTIMVGILGTIIGFYFGTAVEGQGAAQAELGITGPKIVGNLVSGADVTVTAAVAGGEAPYQYSLSFEPEGLLADITGQQSEDGLVAETVTLPEVESTTGFTMTLTATDTNEVTGEASLEEELEPAQARPLPTPAPET